MRRKSLFCFKTLSNYLHYIYYQYQKNPFRVAMARSRVVITITRNVYLQIYFYFYNFSFYVFHIIPYGKSLHDGVIAKLRRSLLNAYWRVCLSAFERVFCTRITLRVIVYTYSTAVLFRKQIDVFTAGIRWREKI